MNRAHRRAMARRHRKVSAVAAVIDAAKARARADGIPFRLLGFVDACSDCTAHADITMNPDGTAMANIWHDDHCPAARGALPWRAAS